MSDNKFSASPASFLPIHPDKPWLAPMAGFSDLPFRLICRHYGCSAAFTEMISAKGLVYQTRNTLKLLETNPEDSPLIVQIFGDDPEVIRKSISVLMNIGFHYFDLNCGCSVKKVVKTGAGASLLKNPTLITEMAQAMSETAGTGRSGIKIRLGWHSEDEVYLELAEKLSGSGIGWITLHPRTAVQLFTGKARWEALKNLKKVTHIPVIASGDLFTARDALDCVNQTGADNVMFARGALSNPSVFNQYINLRKNKNYINYDPRLLQEMCFKTISYYQRYSPSRKAVLKMRTILPRMIRETHGAKELRKQIISCTDWHGIKKAVAGIC